MFQRYVWDIKKALVTGGNKITIKFTSAVTYSAYKSKLYNYTIPPNCPPSVQHGECHVNLIRKKQCSFSWDWGPAFASQGIWKNISIQAFDSALIKDVLVNTIKGILT
ncbi:beta-mannosidase-like isoform X1 [Paramuricea clavata]|uniref:Beta-mannosidase-like isoform X1 n=1 Tax=Paramuricea clavata TaxID=317549 RepID=A0A7D9JS58_PARCT|nr:beta-mannosidase-like isoform X1 [Paramuricea clavata]